MLESVSEHNALRLTIYDVVWSNPVNIKLVFVVAVCGSHVVPLSFVFLTLHSEALPFSVQDKSTLVEFVELTTKLLGIAHVIPITFTLSIVAGG